MKTPRPLPLEPNTGPDFPAEALPSDLGPLVMSVSDCLQVPVSMAAAMALGALSAACSRLVLVEVKPGWLEPLQLYIGVVAPPGAKKSPFAGDSNVTVGSVFPTITGTEADPVAPLSSVTRSSAR